MDSFCSSRSSTAPDPSDAGALESLGHSTHVEGAPPTTAQLLRRSRRAAHYTLADMADDTAALLDRLELGPAHVIGASMGGMIAQTLAARHPQDARSLVPQLIDAIIENGARAGDVSQRHPPSPVDSTPLSGLSG